MTDRQRDRQTDGIDVASTALAMRALRRAVKMGLAVIKHRSESQWTVLFGYLTISANVSCNYSVIYNNFVFHQFSAPVHLAFNTVQLLQCNTLDFLSELWLCNSPELNFTCCDI